MQRLISIFISMLVAQILGLTAASDAEAKSPGDKIFWSGKSDGFTICWRTSDLIVKRGDKEVYSARKDLEATGQIIASDSICRGVHTVKLLSIVGPFLSMRYSCHTDFLNPDGTPATAHPSGSDLYVTMDMRRSIKPIADAYKRSAAEINTLAKPELTDLFPKNTVIDALKRDDLFSNSLQPFHDLPTLRKTLEQFPQLTEGCGTFNPSILNAFYFHHKEGKKVAVRIGIPGSGPCRNNITEAGILLPVTDAIKSELDSADRGKSGILGKGLTALRNAVTTSKISHGKLSKANKDH